MHSYPFTRLSLIIAAGLIGFLIFVSYLLPGAPPDVEVDYGYLDTSRSIEERVEILLAQMSLEEKVGQMALVEMHSVENLNDVSECGIGGILSGAGAVPEPNTVAGWREHTESFYNASKSSRLGIPVLYGADAVHGHGNVPGATIFPHFIGLGATRDPQLVERVAEVTAQELIATGVYWSFSPTLDTVEDIRWGRVYETFSDDPALVSELGAAYVRGLQQETSEELAVLATAKHYIGAGGMVWDTSINDSYYIDQGATSANEEILRSNYLPPFAAAVEEGVGSVMIGLNSWDGDKIAASRYLLTDVLKGELGFDGFTVSDWHGVYETTSLNFVSNIVTINAGLDMVMLPFEYESFIRDVTIAARLGLISKERIDDAVRRILTAKFKLGLFEQTAEIPTGELGAAASRALAREAAARSAVLLKNEADVLPLHTPGQHIRVAGSAAHNIGRQVGAWTIEWQGIDGNWLPGATSILDGIKMVAGNSARIEFDEAAEFETSSLADIGIAIVGELPYAEGVGDNPSPRLSDSDLATIERLEASSERVIVVLVTGRPLIITDQINKWDALVVVWLPGSEGAGVADVIFGRTPFSGMLPLHWPARISQLPIAPNGITADGTPVLFGRYYGLK